MNGKATNGHRKVNEVRREGINQAKMWLGSPGEPRQWTDVEGVRMAALVLVSTQIRMDSIQNKPLAAVKVLT